MTVKYKKALTLVCQYVDLIQQCASGLPRNYAFPTQQCLLALQMVSHTTIHFRLSLSLHFAYLYRGFLNYFAVQGYKPDYMYLLQRTMMDSPDAAVNLAKMIAKQPGPPIELNVIADLFLQRNMVREATAFLLEVLQDDNAEHEKLQTKASIFLPTLSYCEKTEAIDRLISESRTPAYAQAQ